MFKNNKKKYTIIEDRGLKKEERCILFVVSFDKEGTILTIKQTIFQFVEFSKFKVDVLNIQEGIGIISKEVLNRYSAVVIHNTADYYIKNLEMINKFILKRYNGLKILMKQDEHFETNKFVDFIERNKIDLILTLWDVKSAEKVYKNGRNHQLHVMQFLTGYVPDEYKSFEISRGQRNIDVGYRGSYQPLLFGRMAYEKHQIGEKFIEEIKPYKLNCNISSKWEDRIYGDKWLLFLQNCKAVLGVESGSSIVDFDGKAGKKFHSYMRHNPNADEMETLKFLEQFEKEPQYRVVAPRHFEAVACGAMQILYEGEYQNILKPYIHYIPLKRDFSNIKEIVNFIKDDKERNSLVEKAFHDIILSGKFSFRFFVEQFDDIIISILKEKLVS